MSFFPVLFVAVLTFVTSPAEAADSTEEVFNVLSALAKPYTEYRDQHEHRLSLVFKETIEAFVGIGAEIRHLNEQVTKMNEETSKLQTSSVSSLLKTFTDVNHSVEKVTHLVGSCKAPIQLGTGSAVASKLPALAMDLQAFLRLVSIGPGTIESEVTDGRDFSKEVESELAGLIKNDDVLIHTTPSCDQSCRSAAIGIANAGKKVRLESVAKAFVKFANLMSTHYINRLNVLMPKAQAGKQAVNNLKTVLSHHRQQVEVAKASKTRVMAVTGTSMRVFSKVADTLVQAVDGLYCSTQK